MVRSGALDRGDAQAAHFLGQARLGLGHAVLHQLLGLVGVGAQAKVTVSVIRPSVVAWLPM
jgi:hypothetical protein